MPDIPACVRTACLTLLMPGAVSNVRLVCCADGRYVVLLACVGGPVIASLCNWPNIASLETDIAYACLTIASLCDT